MVRCYSGNLGMGKTLNMVYDLMRAMERGRVVISNTPIAFCTSRKPLSGEKGNHYYYNKPCIYKGKHYKARHMEKPQDFIKAFINSHNEIIAIDEAGILFNRRFSKIPPEMLVKVVQSRKVQVDFYYTAQSFMMVDGLFKIITNDVFQCRKHNPFFTSKLPKLHPLSKTKKVEWIPGQVFTARCVDPIFIIKHLSASKRGTGRYYIKYTRSLYPRHYIPAFNAYDTMFMVNGMPVGYQKLKEIPSEDTGNEIEHKETTQQGNDNNILNHKMLIQEGLRAIEESNKELHRVPVVN